ncbi:MAG TPA: histidine phosphatase family protein [Acidimicrobiales bacterium]|nr:histidine phosphatase family protein [Acidimicrobiales bacterium]
MKSLLVLRHGKSDWTADWGAVDAERPLAKRGKKSAELVGRFMSTTANIPNRAVCSPARRAADTLELAMVAGGWRCPVRAAARLYGGGVAGIIGEVRSEPDSTELLLVVGHEPDCSELISVLVGGGSFRVPTGALARLDCDVESWSAVGLRSGTLAFLVTPRLLAGVDLR